jgi:hypothetical protein
VPFDPPTTIQLLNYQITQLPTQDRLPISGLLSMLCLQIACLTAGTAIINTVFAQAGVKQALAQSAVFVAGAASYRLVADHAFEILGHGRRLA